MCFWKKKPAPVPKPEWVTQTERETAKAEIEAAETHYAWMRAIEDGQMTQAQIELGGDFAHHSYWYTKHLEAAYYTCPEYMAEIGWA